MSARRARSPARCRVRPRVHQPRQARCAVDAARGYAAERGPRGLQRCALLLAGLASAFGCAPSAQGTPALPIVATPITPAPPAPPEPLLPDGTPALDASLVERVPEGTFGPYLGAAPDGRAVALWAALAENDGRRWFSSALDARGAPSGAPRALADAPGELSLATVRATGSGFVALATGVTASGTRVEALRLGPAGELLAGPTPLEHSRTEVLWLELLRVGDVDVALWAALAVGAADVALSALRPAGAQPAAPVVVLEDAKAWQAVEFGDSIAIAAVASGASEASRSLLVSFVDDEGHTLHRTLVRSGASIEDRIDAARVGDNLVVAWTERAGADARLWLAALGPDTRLLAPPAPALPPFGRQRLIELLPPGEPGDAGLLAWEHAGQAPRGQRRVLLGRVDERGRVEPSPARLSLADDEDQPELVRKGRGVAGLVRAVSCVRDVTPCATPEPVPGFVELGAALEPLASEPIRLAPQAGKTAELAWGLHCTAASCSALAALPEAPVPIYGVELRPRSQSWTPIASQVVPTLPRATESTTVAETPLLADVVSARVGRGWLLGTLTQFDDATPYVLPTTPAPDGKLAPVRAVLSVQPFATDGRAEPARVISYRARAASGIALARLSADRALLAWSALDRQRPEVFATLVARNGQPALQRMLTNDAGDISAVAAAPLDKGAVVAWIGDRDGAPRLFAARLNEMLLRTAPEQRLSAEAGFTGLALLQSGGEAWLAACRQDERAAVLSLLRLDPRSGARRGDELVLRRAEGVAFSSPVLAARGEGALLGWVERPLMGGGEGGRAFLLELDAQGRGVGEPVAVASTAGEATALRLHCDGAGCQGAIDARPPEGSSIEAFEWAPSSAPSAKPLAHRASASSDPPAFALADAAVFHADRVERRGLLRRIGVAWR